MGLSFDGLSDSASLTSGGQRVRHKESSTFLVVIFFRFAMLSIVLDTILNSLELERKMPLSLSGTIIRGSTYEFPGFESHDVFGGCSFWDKSKYVDSQMYLTTMKGLSYMLLRSLLQVLSLSFWNRSPSIHTCSNIHFLHQQSRIRELCVCEEGFARKT